MGAGRAQARAQGPASRRGSHRIDVALRRASCSDCFSSRSFLFNAETTWCSLNSRLYWLREGRGDVQ